LILIENSIRCILASVGKIIIGNRLPISEKNSATYP
jgi:hypothetical protein